MKNLKRILSLALASTMLIGMMVVGASAASFSDTEGNDHEAAIETMAALGIINGFEDGSFKPEDTLTRAQMAKMLGAIYNKGDGDLSFAAKDKPSFTDVKATSWYNGAVEYAVNFGIVKGNGDGTFAPEKKLSAIEAARMTLNAMGIEQGDTDNWKLTTVVQARDAGLYRNLTGAEQTAAEMTRGAAAQMLNNALIVPMGEGNTYKTTEDIDGIGYKLTLTAAGKTVLSNDATKIDNLEGMKFASVADASEMAKANGLTTPATHYTIEEIPIKVGEKEIDTPETLGHKFLAMNTKGGVLNSVKYLASDGVYENIVGADTVYYTGEDYSDLIGRNITVVYKANDDVYGVFAGKGKVLFEGSVADLPTTGVLATDTTVTVKGVKYDIDPSIHKTNNVNDGKASNVPFYAVNNPTALGSGLDSIPSGAKVEYAMKGIDTNGNGKLNRIVVVPVELAKVTNVTKSSVTLAKSATTTTYYLEKVGANEPNLVAYEGVALGDYVLLSPSTNTVSQKYEITKAETKTGTVSGVKGTTNLLIDGEWYGVSAVKLPHSTPGLGADVTLVLVNGCYGYAEASATAAASKELVVLTAIAANPTEGLVPYLEARAYFVSEGVTKTIKVKDQTTDPTAGKLYAATVKNDIYTLTTPDAAAAGMESTSINTDGFKKATNGVSAKIGGNLIADDAVIVILHNDGNKKDLATGATTATDVTKLTKVEIVTGAAIKAWGNNYGADGKTQAFCKIQNGINYVKVAFIAADAQNLPSDAGEPNNYGWVISAPYKTLKNDTEVYAYDLWNGEENISVYSEVSVSNGDVISYTDNGNGMITVDRTVTATQTGAVLGYSKADGVIKILTGTNTYFASGAATIDDDTKVLFIDKTAGTGVAGGEIRLASEDVTEAGKYVENVLYDYSGTHVNALVVEVNNSIAGVTPTYQADNYTVSLDTSITSGTTGWSVEVKYKGAPFTTATKVKDGDKIEIIATLKAGNTNNVGFDITNNGTDFSPKLEQANKTAQQTWTAGTTKVSFELEIGSDITLKIVDKNP